MRLLSLFVLSIFLATVSCSIESSPSTSTVLDQTVNNLKTVIGCQSPLAGVSFDLSVLTSTADYTGTSPDNAYTYFYNPCGVANGNPTGSKCQTAQSTLCQKSSTGAASMGTCTVPATGPSPTPPTWALIDQNKPGAGVKVTYANGDTCNAGNGIPFKTGIINFICDPTATQRGFVNGSVVQNPDCVVTLNIITSAVCPHGGGEQKGLSGGWIFIIILIVLIVLYIVVGCVYQRKKKGANGMESCPNIEFWRGLPGLVKEGFTFTWSKIRGLCGKGEYTEVK